MCTVFWPDEDFVNFVVSTVDIPGVNISDATFVGFSPKFGMDAFHIALIIELALLLAFIGSINIYCAKKIKAFLKNVARSSNFLTLQRQMYALLLVQATCPLVFSVAPYCFSMSLIFTGINSTQHITNTLSILFALYPVFNPIIIITFVKEYRTFMFTGFKTSSVRPAHAPVLNSRMTTETRRTSSIHI
ncbi:hypothetical protein GCK32_020794 [Trichostrongylus colubriformis]|uniref:Uncharacterized protein n=1 Tax=Trichostrongylus colubriformis TaxID=6319 RepID=A0AAN8J1V4_TRICO